MAGFSKYPNQLNTSTELPLVVDKQTPVNAEYINRAYDAIKSIEAALGINPGGPAGTVRAALENINLILGASGGDFSSLLQAINQLQATVNTFDGDITALQSAVSSLQSAVSALQSLTTTHTGQISTLNSTVSGLSSTSATHTSQISTLQGTTATHTSQISALQSADTTINNSILSLQNSLATTNSDVDIVQADIVSIEAELADHETRIDALEAGGGGGGSTFPDGYSALIYYSYYGVQDINNRLGNSIQGAFPTATARFVDIENDILALQNGSVPGLDGYLSLINSINSELGVNPSGLFNTVVERFNDIDGDFSVVNSHLTQIDGYITSHTNTLNTHTSQIATNTTNITTNTNSISAINALLGSDPAGDFPDLTTRLANLASAPVVPFSNPITIDSFSTSYVPPTVSLQFTATTTGHINGYTKTYIINPLDVPNLTFSSSFQIVLGSFNSNKRNIIEISCVGFELIVKIYSFDQVLEISPYLYSATILTSQKNILRLHYDSNVSISNINDLSLSFTSGTPKTILSYRSGNGTPNLLFDLSGNISETDVFDLIIGTNHTITGGIPAISQTISVGWYTVPNELSGTYIYFDADENFTVSNWNSFQTNSIGGDAFVQATSADQPTYKDYNGTQVPSFGSTDFMVDNQGINGSVSATTGWFEVDFLPRTISTNNTGANIYLNSGPLQDSGGYVGVPYLRSPSTDNEVATAGNEDGTSSQVSTPIHLSYPTTIRCIHADGYLSIQRNYRAASQVVSGNMNPGGLWRINKGFSAIFGDMEIHSITIASIPPSIAQQAGMRTYRSERAWALGYNPKINLPPRYYARVGQQTKINFENITISNDWYPLSGNVWGFEVKVDGYSVGSVSIPNWTWTPSVATSNSTLEINILRNGKRIGTKKCPLTVVPSTGTGTKRVCVFGDSWAAAPSNGGFSISQNIYSSLNSAGFNVIMNGQRGSAYNIDGYAINTTNNQIQITSHGFSLNLPIQFYRTSTTYTYPTLSVGNAFNDYPYVQKYVRSIPDANHFTISDSPGGVENDFATTGSGFFSIRRTDTTQDYNDALGGLKWSNFDGTVVVPGYISPLVNNGQIDIANYISSVCDGYAPTHCVFQLGINGGNQINVNNFTIRESDNDSILRGPSARIINAWREEVPNIKIILVLPSHQNILNSAAVIASTTRWELLRMTENIRQVYLDLWGGREADGIYLVDAYGGDPFVDAGASDAYHLVSYYGILGQHISCVIQST